MKIKSVENFSLEECREYLNTHPDGPERTAVEDRLDTILHQKKYCEEQKEKQRKLYRDGRLVTTVTTNSAGYAYVSELSEGYYEVEEVAAPAGYILDTERHGIYINPYDPAVENDPILVLTNSKKPTLIIEKLDTQTLKPIIPEVPPST